MSLIQADIKQKMIENLKKKEYDYKKSTTADIISTIKLHRKEAEKDFKNNKKKLVELRCNVVKKLLEELNNRDLSEAENTEFKLLSTKALDDDAYYCIG